MSMTRRTLVTNGSGLLALSALFWLGVGILRAAPVTAAAWATLFVLCGVVALLLWTRGPSRAGFRDWMSAALYAAWLAVFCYGVVRGLDALYGAHRLRAHPEGLLGGLELWTLLCPGALSVALSGVVRSLLVRHWVVNG